MGGFGPRITRGVDRPYVEQWGDTQDERAAQRAEWRATSAFRAAMRATLARADGVERDEALALLAMTVAPNVHIDWRVINGIHAAMERWAYPSEDASDAACARRHGSTQNAMPGDTCRVSGAVGVQ